MTAVLARDKYEEFLTGKEYSRDVNGRALKNVDNIETLFCIEILLVDASSSVVDGNTLTLTLTSGSVFTFTKLLA